MFNFMFLLPSALKSMDLLARVTPEQFEESMSQLKQCWIRCDMMRMFSLLLIDGPSVRMLTARFERGKIVMLILSVVSGHCFCIFECDAYPLLALKVFLLLSVGLLKTSLLHIIFSIGIHRASTSPS